MHVAAMKRIVINSLAAGAVAGWLAACGGGASAPAPAAIPAPAPSGWTLSWSDEFDGTTLDASKWNVEASGTGGGNAELEYYTTRSQNVSVSAGNLVLTALQESYTGPDGTRSYTSGRINTRSRFSQAYGRMEARMKLPAGQGLWPAFWMLGANIGSVGWPASGEIDIMEHINNEAMVHGTIHWADVNGIHVQYGLASGNVDVTQWHVYAVEWDTNTIHWFVDGTEYMTASIQNNVNNTAAFHNPFFLILNLAVGGNWPGNPNGTVAFPQQMLVDYVRVYTK